MLLDFLYSKIKKDTSLGCNNLKINKMICSKFKAKDCKGCPEYDKDYCEGVKEINKKKKKMVSEVLIRLTGS